MSDLQNLSTDALRALLAEREGAEKAQADRERAEFVDTYVLPLAEQIILTTDGKVSDKSAWAGYTLPSHTVTVDGVDYGFKVVMTNLKVTAERKPEFAKPTKAEQTRADQAAAILG